MRDTMSKAFGDRSEMVVRQINRPRFMAVTIWRTAQKRFGQRHPNRLQTVSASPHSAGRVWPCI
jgi:hypothetical protein